MSEPVLQPAPTAVAPKASGLSIAGFVVSFFASVVGLILSIVALSQIKKSNGTIGGRGLAIAGIVIGAVGTVVWLIWLVFLIIFIIAAAASGNLY